MVMMSHSNSISNTINTTTATTATVPVVTVLPSDDVDSVLMELQRRKNSHEGIVALFNIMPESIQMFVFESGVDGFISDEFSK